MGLATIDPHSQKEQKDMRTNPDLSGFVCISIHFFVNYGDQ